MLSRRSLNLGAAVLALAFATTACRSDPVTARDSNVLLGDTMHGRVVPGGNQQTFTFEGVESTILDAYVKTDDHDAAPMVAIHDPEGVPLVLDANTNSKPGDDEFVLRGLVLPKTGKYRVITRPSDPDRTVFYKFTYGIRWAAMPDRKVHLSASQPTPVRVAAPRGGVITFSIKPQAKTGVVPQIQAVKDPWGGPALDRSQVPEGAPLPEVSLSDDGKTILTFTAARPGVYTILAGAKPGREGVGTLHVGLKEPERPGRLVYHDDGAARRFGIPGRTTDTAASAAPVALRVRTPQGMPPRPPPPSMEILQKRARVGQAVTPPPIDPAIALR